MQIGLTFFPTDTSIGIAELAREAEARGFSSLWVSEHTHIPVGRRTAYPPGGDLPEEYRRTLDPYVALTAAAAATTRLRLATGVTLIAQRDPIVTAKAVASLDLLSGGRFDLGVGYGWNVDEFEDHGAAGSTRRAVVRERVLAMQELWGEDVASFEGAHVSLSPSWAWPKPVQAVRGRAGVPVYMGGRPGPTLFSHIAEFADGWLPLGGVDAATAVDDLRAAFEAAGRDPSTVDVIPYVAPPDRAALDRFAAIGVTQAVFLVPSAGREAVLPVLDRLAGFVTPGP